jgi:hypothetical protein
LFFGHFPGALPWIPMVLLIDGGVIAQIGLELALPVSGLVCAHQSQPRCPMASAITVNADGKLRTLMQDL